MKQFSLDHCIAEIACSHNDNFVRKQGMSRARPLPHVSRIIIIIVFFFLSSSSYSSSSSVYPVGHLCIV